MKKRLIVIFLALLLILTVSLVLAHGGEETSAMPMESSQIFPVTTWQVVGYGSLAFGVLILIMVAFHNQMSNNVKKIVFFLVAAVSIIVTIFLVVTTIYLNIVSETKGPVHWHADYEIWQCDMQIELFAPSGLSNKQGTDTMHAHDDDRIHVEGVLLDKKSANLDSFFHAVGGHLLDDGYAINSRDGPVEVTNGDLCNGQPGRLYVFVNGNLIEHPDDYIISPYETVPPGDRIKIIFTEKPMEQINPYILKDSERPI